MSVNRQLTDDKYQSRLFGLAGWSGSGKTTLAEKIIKIFVEKGYSISSIKHAHHKFEADIVGKDSWRHRKAGAQQVIVSSDFRTAFFTEHQKNNIPSLCDLIAKLNYTDFILVEGYKKISIPKIEVYRKKIKKPNLYQKDKNIIAIASDNEIKNCPLPVIDLNNCEDIVSFILNFFTENIENEKI